MKYWNATILGSLIALIPVILHAETAKQPALKVETIDGNSFDLAA